MKLLDRKEAEKVKSFSDLLFKIHLKGIASEIIRET
jgi:hypothetical protein